MNVVSQAKLTLRSSNNDRSNFTGADFIDDFSRRNIDFCDLISPRKLNLINSKPLQIDFMVKNRPRKLCPMIIRYRAENPRKALY